MKGLIYVANNYYKNSSSTSAIEWALWEIDSSEIFDLWGAHLLLEVLISKVRVWEYHDDSEIVREIYQNWDLEDRIGIEVRGLEACILHVCKNRAWRIRQKLCEY